MIPDNNPLTAPSPAKHSSKRRHLYICFDCADGSRQGRKHTSAGAFTAHTGICDKCGKKKTLGHVRDFGLDEQLVFRNLTPLD